MRSLVIISVLILVLAMGGILYRVLTYTPPLPNHAACWGVTPDDAEAARIRQGAANGDAKSQYETGLMVLYGRDGEPNTRQALEWLEKSAAQSYADAQNKIGEIYSYNYFGVPRDLKISERFYRLAAEQGHLDAMFNLSNLLHGYHGRGKAVPLNEPEAILWQSRYHQQKDGLQYHYETSPQDTAHINAIRAKAEAGDRRAQFDLYLLHSGSVTPQDEKEKLFWLEKSAAQDYPPAHYKLYLETKDTDPARSLKELERAAELDDVEAIYKLAYKHTQGERMDVIRVQSKESIALFNRGLALNDPQAMLAMGRIYWRGAKEVGIAQDKIRAYALLTRTSRDPRTHFWSGLHEDCDFYASQMTPDELVRGKKLSVAP